MPRTSEQFKAIKDERKRLILEVSADLFALKDDKRVSVDQICSKANCSHGLIYHYFSNVDDIYKEILKNEIIKSLKEELSKSLKESPLDGIKGIIYMISDYLKEDSTISLVSVFLDDENKPSFKATLEALVKKGQKDKTISSGNPMDIVTSCYLIFKGYCQNKLLNRKSLLELPDKDVILGLFLRGSIL